MRGVAPNVEQYGGVSAGAPLLILIGDKDDWTPAEPCRKLTEAAQQAATR
jgi:dienelactone hydrolase